MMRLGSVNRQILSLAIPSIVANVTTPLLAFADTAIVGHMGSPVYIAAIAVGGTLFNMLYWLFGFLRMGSSGLTAQQYGMGQDGDISQVLHRSLSLSFIGAFLIILSHSLLLTVMLRFFGSDPETDQFVGRYFNILVYGAPAVLASYSLNGWFIGIQDTRTPMWVSLSVNVINILVSLTMVFILRLSIAGVAIGTLVAQWSGFLMLLFFAIRRGYSLRTFTLKTLTDGEGLRKFFSVNVDIFLRTLCLIAVTVWFTRVGAREGAVMLSVNALLMQFFILFSYFMDGFAYAAEGLAGSSLGAGDYSSLRKIIANLFRWGVGVAVFFTVVYGIWGDWILSVLSDEESVISASADYRWWVLAIPFAGFASFTWDGIFIGLTKTGWMLLSMAGAMAVFFIVLNLTFPSMGNNGLWLAFILYLFTRGVVLTAVYLLGFAKK